jgi:chaperonin GroEL (HSP60 family)
VSKMRERLGNEADDILPRRNTRDRSRQNVVKHQDLVAAGVIDPTMVTRTALQNAASIAALLLTTEALISEIKEDQKSPVMPQGGGMGDMY